MNCNDPQPTPSGAGTTITELVVSDLRERSKMGEKKYGTVLRANNGRDALIDAYQEALDLVQYFRQLITERDLLPKERLTAREFIAKREAERKKSVTEEAHSLVTGDRGGMYGHPFDDFGKTAGMLNVLLADKLKSPMSQEDVAMMMICVKLSRERNHPKRDNTVDIAGYAETLEMVKEERERRGKQEMR